MGIWTAKDAKETKGAKGVSWSREMGRWGDEEQGGRGAGEQGR